MTRLDVFYPPTHAVGVFHAWLAEGFREGNTIERACIFPLWMVARGVFLAGYWAAGGA